jgi:hypothetical protein
VKLQKFISRKDESNSRNLFSYDSLFFYDISYSGFIETFLRTIFNKINHTWNNYSCSLYIHVPTIDDQLITYEKLLINYTIERVIEIFLLKIKYLLVKMNRF